MKKLLFSNLLLWCVVASSLAQTTILDFETPATSTVFQYFGSSLDPTPNQVIDNPNPTGINTSSKVAKFIKPAVAETWAGAFSNPNPTAVVDLAANNRVAVKVHMDHIGSVTLKLEQSSNGGSNWAVTLPNTKINEWEEIIFDASTPSFEPGNPVAAGFTYARVVLFFDFGNVGTGTDVTSYFDDIVALPAPAATSVTILDFETPATTGDFQYFGSALDGSLAPNVTNPNPTGINTSATVVQYVKPGVSQVWAGAFATPNPTTAIDFTNGGQICVKVHMDHIGSVSIKLEERIGGGDNWIVTLPNTKVNEWEELCFDSSLPAIEGNPTPAAGAAFAKLVIFIDFGTAGTGTDVTTYFDDFIVKSSAAPTARTVNFKVDMNQYAPDFTTVYVSGSFNNWSDNANPLADANGDGIWEGSISLPNGAYEYKIQLDAWAAQEQFTGLEACTKRTDDFVNRKLLVSSDLDVPQFCFNSCYACGDEVKLTFKLGMNGVTPNAEGVWLAGGGNFDSPGGPFKMNDANGDGIFEIVVPRQKGFGSYYVFANGPCPDYSCKEQLEGLPCGDPNNFNDRRVNDVQSDTTITLCFGTCITNEQCISSTTNPQLDAQVFSLRGNPIVNGVTILDFGVNQNESKLVTLTNAIGQVMQSYQVEQHEQVYTMPVQTLQAGIYFVTVTTGDRYFTRKVVKY